MTTATIEQEQEQIGGNSGLESLEMGAGRIQVDDKHISDGEPGPVTKKLQSSYFDLIHGKSSKYNNWLSLV